VRDDASSATRADLGDAVVPPPPQTGTTFPLLDTMRAIGALCVLTTHAAFWAGDYTRNGTLGTVLARLDVGVAIFFVLSGFLLSRAWLARAADRAPAPRVGPYLWKRFLRIVPVYVVTVVLALTFVEANDDATATGWLSTLLMLDVYHGEGFPAGLTQMWSLAAEVAFYLVLPLLMLVLVGRRGTLRPRRVLAGLLVLVAVSVWWHVRGAAHVGQGRPLEWLPAFLTWFAAGIWLALVEVLHARDRLPRLSRPFVALARQPGSCWALVVGLMLVSATPLAGPTMLAAPTTAESLAKHLIYAGVGFLIVLTGIFNDPLSTYSRAMGHPWGRRLGWISYGVFCLHLPILHFVMWSTGWPLFVGRGPAIWALTLLLSLVAAELSYRIVERPALRLKGLWSRPGRTADTSRPASGTTIT
jgi:peptidoglycan/LPS O-acetylase OafA/YrhL